MAAKKWTADVVMAHEYAHLVQGRAGIAISAYALAQRSGDKGTEFAYVRRLETQADCFSGMFLRSVSLRWVSNRSMSRASSRPTRPSVTTR